MDNHGTRVIQTLIEVLGKHVVYLHDVIMLIISELDQNIFEMSTHANGNHVIQ